MFQSSLYHQLLSQWRSGRLPHAILLDGPEGAGHLNVALQDGLQAQQEVTVACGTCPGCVMTQKWAHPDLHFVFPVIRPKNASSTTRVVCDLWIKEWREMLKKTTHFDLELWEKEMGIENQQPQIFADESDELVGKLALSDSMNTACANKLLKLLEEPPSRTVFLLVSHRAEGILPTILSRTQRLTVKAIPEAEMAEHLVRERGVSAEDAAYVAHTAQGNYVRALRLLSVGHNEQEFLDLFVLLMRKCYLRDIKEMHAWSELVASWGRERQKAFLDYAMRMVRENFVMNFHRPELNYMTRAEEEFSVRFSPFINERNVLGISDELALARRDIAQNVNAKMVFFDFALKMIVLLIQ